MNDVARQIFWALFLVFWLCNFGWLYQYIELSFPLIKMLVPLNIMNMIDTKTIAGYIFVLEPINLQQKIPFYSGINIIGRSSSKATLVINQASISQKHAKLIVTEGKMTIVDLQSKNGIKINNDLNLIEKNKEFLIEESMVIYLAEAKCRFQMVKQVPKKQVEKNKSKNEKEKMKSNKQLFSLFDQDELNSRNKIETKQKVPQNASIIRKDVKPQQQKVNSIKTSEATKESDNITDFTFQKNNGQKNIQVADKNAVSKIIEKNKQKNAKKLNIINEILQIKEACDISLTEEPIQKSNISKQKEIKNKKQRKEKKMEKQQSIQEDIQIKKQVTKNKKEVKKQVIPQVNNNSKKSGPKIEQRLSLSPKKVKQDSKKNQKLKDKGINAQKQERQDSFEDTKHEIKVSKDKNKNRKSKQKPVHNNSDENQGYKTKRMTKRLPSESLQRQLGIVPRRSTYINKRILTSGFQLLLIKKYFLPVQSIDEDYDYLIMKNYLRTFKALFSISKGILIVRNEWVKDSQCFEKIMDVQKYLFEEVDYIYEAIEKVKAGERIFKKYEFYLLSKEYHIKNGQVEILIQACGGIVMGKAPQKPFKDKQSSNKIAIIRNYSRLQEVKEQIKQAKALGFTKIYSIQMILDSCEKQQINWKSNQLSHTTK